MGEWKTCYEHHKKREIWRYIEKAIKGLEGNQDIKITTHPDYVVGYLVEQLSGKFRFLRKPTRK